MTGLFQMRTKEVDKYHVIKRTISKKNKTNGSISCNRKQATKKEEK